MLQNNYIHVILKDFMKKINNEEINYSINDKFISLNYREQSFILEVMNSYKHNETSIDVSIHGDDLKNNLFGLFTLNIILNPLTEEVIYSDYCPADEILKHFEIN